MAGLNFLAYAVSSSVLTTSVILNAYATKQQFYSTVIYLVKSKFSLLVLFNFAFVLFFILAKVTRRIFFGRLRASEIELLWENTGYAITETCLALTIFRDELTLNTYLLFSCLLFFKGFHWLCKARVEHIEQDEERYRSISSQLRIASFICLLLFSDILISFLSASIIMEEGVSVQLLFGFEFLLLSIAACSILIKYFLVAFDTYFVTGRWYNKSLYEMYLRLFLAIVHFGVYTTFFCIIFTFYGVPIHLMRSLYISFHTVTQRLKHFLQFRRVTASLNTRFADASEEELEATDRVCVICREEMFINTQVNSPETRIKKLSCGHIFHFYCLRNWFERQLKCPTCRADIASLSRPSAMRDRMNRNQRHAARNNNNNNERAAENQPAQDAAGEPEEYHIPFDQEIEEEVQNAQERARELRAMNAAVQQNLDRIERRQQGQEDIPVPPPPRSASMTSTGVPTAQQGTNGINNPILEAFNPNRNYLSVNDYLQNQVEFLSLQLQIYSAQIAAANAAHEAARALVAAQDHANTGLNEGETHTSNQSES